MALCPNKLVNAKQLQRFLDDAGMSQRGAARELGIDERTMRRYVRDELPVPRVVEFALRWLASQRAAERPARHK
jgi:transposase